MNANTTATPQWRGVFFDGPQSDQNADGEEIPVWFVNIGDEDMEPVGKVYRSHDYTAAAELARQMSRDHGLEIISDALPD